MLSGDSSTLDSPVQLLHTLVTSSLLQLHNSNTRETPSIRSTKMAVEIPAELLDIILQHLVRDRALATIGALQATASQYQHLEEELTASAMFVPVRGPERCRDGMLEDVRRVIQDKTRRDSIR